jgi:hypothetical protein
MIWAKVHFP